MLIAPALISVCCLLSIDYDYDYDYEGGTFMHSSKCIRPVMGLYFASLASLVKPHDTVDPNFEITTHSLRPKKNGETQLQTTTEQWTSVTFSRNKSTAT